MTKKLTFVWWLVGFAAAYLLMFMVGESSRFHGLQGQPPPFYPAIGVYFAAALQLPRRHWPILVLTAFGLWALYPLISQLPEPPLPARSLSFLANTVAVLAGALLYPDERSEAGRHQRSRPDDGMRVLRFLAVTALFVPALNATLIKIPAVLFQLEPYQSNPWLGFFETDGLGLLAVTPFFLAVARPADWRGLVRAPWTAANSLGSLALTLGAALVIFGDFGLPGFLSRPFLILPFLVLVAFQGIRGLSSTATLIVALVTVLASSHGHGPFRDPRHTLGYDIGEMQLFVATITLMSALLTEAVVMRQALAATLRTTNRALTDEMRRRAEVEERLELAIEAADLGVWESRLDTGEEVWSQRWREILGMPFDTPSSLETFLAAVVPADRERLRARSRAVATGLEDGIFCDEFGVVWPDGSKHCARIQSKSYAVQTPQGLRTVRIAGTLQDVTEEKAARQALERASEEKSRFLANMSHEIRSPLGAMLGFAELVLDPATPEAERRQFAELIRKNGQHLGQLVDQILDLSKVESGRLEIVHRTVVLRELLGDVTTLMGLRAKEKGLALVVSVSPRTPALVVTDPLRLRQILINALGNAIKFTAAGHVGLAVDAEPDAAGRWRLRIDVSDTGIGLSEAEQAPLFQPFAQASVEVQSRYGGTGLGLALSRRLARLLGGDYVLHASTKGRGSVFRLEVDGGFVEATAVPALAAAHEKSGAAHPPAAVPPTPQPLSGRRILLADDFADSRLLVRRYLELAGATVDSVENGLEAVAKASAAHYDVLLMDLQMPELDGFGAAAQLRSRAYRGAIVALTGRTMAEEVEAALKAGFDAHVGKPIDRRTLLATLDAVLH